MIFGFSFLKVFINVPWWYLAFYAIINPFLTQRTKSKFVFAGPSKSAETLFKLVDNHLFIHILDLNLVLQFCILLCGWLVLTLN